MISYEKLLEKVLRAAEMLPDEDRRAFHYFSNTNEIHGDAVITLQAQITAPCCLSRRFPR